MEELVVANKEGIETFFKGDSQIPWFRGTITIEDQELRVYGCDATVHTINGLDADEHPAYEALVKKLGLDG